MCTSVLALVMGALRFAAVEPGALVAVAAVLLGRKRKSRPHTSWSTKTLCFLLSIGLDSRYSKVLQKSCRVFNALGEPLTPLVGAVGTSRFSKREREGGGRGRSWGPGGGVGEVFITVAGAVLNDTHGVAFSGEEGWGGDVVTLLA